MAAVMLLTYHFFPEFLLLDNEEDNDNNPNNNVVARTSSPVIRRIRTNVSTIFAQLGPTSTRRAFRMHESQFMRLHQILFPYRQFNARRSSPRSIHPNGKSQRKGAANGLIHSSTRLAVALRFFAGGSPYDIALVNGISLTEVYRSVWTIVNRVNRSDSPELAVAFPTDHSKQLEIAQGFKSKSKAGFDCCVGAIDGILIWTEMPNPIDCLDVEIFPLKFMCGRKKKYGFNMMATVDHNGRFLDIEIRHPGSTSDFLAFATSHLKAKLDTPGFLSPGLALFGDNAYGNSHYMVTPFKGAKVGEVQDDFNFYQSQVRIHVECAFGRYVHRWGILRRPLPSSFGLARTTALVMCLCRLHNFCTDSSGANLTPAEPPLLSDMAVGSPGDGVVQLEVTDDNPMSPVDLIDGSDHYDDIPRDTRRLYDRATARVAEILPQQVLLSSVVNQGLKRPTPRRW
jgi:hypothetical protein